MYPTAPNFYPRSAVEISTMRAFGRGTFHPTDPFVKISFAISRLPEGGLEPVITEFRIDKVAYASPALMPREHFTHSLKIKI